MSHSFVERNAPEPVKRFALRCTVVLVDVVIEQCLFVCVCVCVDLSF